MPFKRKSRTFQDSNCFVVGIPLSPFIQKNLLLRPPKRTAFWNSILCQFSKALQIPFPKSSAPAGHSPFHSSKVSQVALSTKDIDIPSNKALPCYKTTPSKKTPQKTTDKLCRSDYIFTKYPKKVCFDPLIKCPAPAGGFKQLRLFVERRYLSRDEVVRFGPGGYRDLG